jgi:hypothetical protein
MKRFALIATLMMAACPWGVTLAETLRPVEDRDLGQSGRAWMVNPAGGGDGSLQQVDDVSPAIVGDGAQDQGWGYLLAFEANAALAQAGKVVLKVNTGKAIGPGAHADIKLYLLDASLEPQPYSAFRAYNTAVEPAVHEDVIGPTAGNQSFSFDVSDMLSDAGGVESGQIVYFLLACDPIAQADGQGGHLEFISRGEDRPALEFMPAD